MRPVGNLTTARHTLVPRLRRVIEARRRAGTTAPPAPDVATPRRGGLPGGDAPGRWIRTVPARPQPAAFALDREVDDPVQAGAVHSGWLLVEAHERLSQSGAHRVFGPELHAWNRYTRAHLTEVVAPPEDPWACEVGRTEANRLRFRRMLDLTLPGDRVFDVGSGSGYLACLLLRDGDAASYTGIELSPRKVAVARRLLEVNDVPAERVDNRVGDLYEVTAADAADATLMTCCEVLEHVPDPESALRILAEALPERADLLFSVPLHGRLESVWGHRTVFDAARVKHMLDEAGLWVQHVEPLANTWTLVLASRSATPSARVRGARRRPPERANSALSTHQDFVAVPSQEVALLGSARRVSSGDTRLRVGPDPGGVTVPVMGLEAVRLRIHAVDLAGAEQIEVAAFAGPARVCRWTWDIEPGAAPTGTIGVALRPGESGARFRSTAPRRRVNAADRIDITVRPAPGGATFAVDVAYLP